MQRQNSSTKVSADDIAAVLRTLKELRRQMPFLIILTPLERRRRPHIGLRHLGSVKSSLMAAHEHPDILPARFDLEQFAEDVRVTDALHSCLHELRELTANVQDTLMEKGLQTLKVSQHVRASIFAAAKI